MMNHSGTAGTTKCWPVGVARVLACVANVAAAFGGVRAELPKEIRVVTYNIHYGEGVDGQIDLPQIAKVLLAEKPDVVALQQVDQKTKRANGIDQAAELARLTKMEAVFDRAIDFDGGAYGHAVLTKLPVRSHESVPLKSFKKVSPEKAEQHAVQLVEVGEKDGPGLLLLCTVLDYRQDQDGKDERLASARTINDLIAKRGDAPAILAGTMNAAPKNLSIVEFAKQWKIAGVNREGTGPQAEGIGDEKKLRLLYTYPAQRPRYPLNYVMCQPAERWQVVEVRVLNEAANLYHLPVLAVLRRVENGENSK